MLWCLTKVVKVPTSESLGYIGYSSGGTYQRESKICERAEKSKRVGKK